MTTTASTNSLPDVTLPNDVDTFEPVDLDPPAPEIVQWQELVELHTYVVHDGDAEKLIPFPRPTWAEPDCDIIGSFLDTTYYASEFANVPLTRSRGDFDETVFEPACFQVRAKLCGDGEPLVGLTLRRIIDGKWSSELGAGMTRAEATELAAALIAAVAVHGPRDDC